MTASTSAVGPVPPCRTGYLSVLLPATAHDDDIPALIRRVVIDALAASGEWPVRTDVVTSERTPRGPMKRWFVEYETGPPDEGENYA